MVGDGDFAFSSRLATTGTYTVTATTIDSEAELEARYPDTFPRHRAAVTQRGGTCLYGVDARQLGVGADAPYSEFRRAPFDRLVWHNPYTETAALQTHKALAARKVHKRLVADFLSCAPAVLKPGGVLVVSINPSESALVGEAFLLKAAIDAGFVLAESYPFDVKREHEYVLRYGGGCTR